ncbi:MAG: hypothetical protein ABR499_20815 [Gemmatimonadaceae bacterium]
MASRGLWIVVRGSQFAVRSSHFYLALMSGDRPHPAAEPELVARIRRILLALVLLGIAGLSLELFLLEHTESATQLIPFAVLGAGFAGTLTVAARPAPRNIRVFQLVMLLFVVSGLLGLYLHLRGNIGFERETDPSARGLDLVWRSLRGGVPLLAPAAMAQLGLLGLVFAYRHPALHGAAPTKPQETS